MVYWHNRTPVAKILAWQLLWCMTSSGDKYVHIMCIHCRLCIYVSCACTWQIIRIHHYVMHTPQRMNLKHPNVLELLGVTQVYNTCLVMPSVQRQSIQVCSSVAPSRYVRTYVLYVRLCSDHGLFCSLTTLFRTSSIHSLCCHLKQNFTCWEESVRLVTIYIRTYVVSLVCCICMQDSNIRII